MKKAGIAADNYKIEKFKEELNKAGFTDYEVKPLTKAVQVIYVNTSEDKLKKLKKLCEDVEAHFNKVKAKFN